MRCPTCGHQNNDLATRCSACGSPLPASFDEEPTVPNDPLGASGTAERAQVVADAPRPKLERPSRLGAMAQRIGAFFGSHQRALGIGLAVCVVAVIGVVWFVSGITDAPTYAQIESDVAKLLPTYDYSGGTYGYDQSLELGSVMVTRRQRTQAPEGTQTDARHYAFAVDAEAIYDNGKLRVVRDVSATYTYGSGSWNMAGELAERGLSLTTHVGVDESKVLANMGVILDAATPVGGDPLSNLYADASFLVVGNTFDDAPQQDTATNDLVIHCSREAGFFAYDGNVVAHFAFESGSWRLRSAEAEAGTAQRNYAPLVGTWSGTLVAHDAGGGSCYGAQNKPLTVTVSSAEDATAGGTITGTLSGLVHLHGKLDNDASTHAGDRLLENTPFEGVISSSFDAETGSNLNAQCTVQAEALGVSDDKGNGREEGEDQGDEDEANQGGDTFGDAFSTDNATDAEVSLQLSFGTDEDPSLVVARVTTTYRYEELLFLLLPHQTTAQFTDTYLLTRVA